MQAGLLLQIADDGEEIFRLRVAARAEHADRLSIAAVCRDSKSRKTRVGEFVGVAVTQFDLDPRVVDRPV